MEQTIVTHQQVKQAFENYLKLLYLESTSEAECQAAFDKCIELQRTWESQFAVAELQ